MTLPDKIHVGCGRRRIPGWFHIDADASLPGLDLVADAGALSNIADSTASILYASHVLEHYATSEIPQVLGEWRRVLKVGGILRLSVPDFGRWAALYVLRGAPLSAVRGSIIGGQKTPWDFHKTLFDETTLRAALIEAGFLDPRLWYWQRTEHAHVDDFSQAYWPHMDKICGTLMSLNLEATK